MKHLILFLSIFFCMGTTQGQEVVKLWNGDPPTSNESSGQELASENGRVSNVSEPIMTIYRPDEGKNKHVAIVICPGGGYSGLAIHHEGYDFAEWLKSEGYTAIVLKYRLPNKHKEVPLDDVQQALRYVRSQSKGWNVEKVGVAGFSAGGHLASTASTHFGQNDTRPDFSILFYPVISMGEYTHQGSRNKLLGDKPSLSELYSYSNEKQINTSTPPTILLLSDDDKAVPPENSIMYYEALKKNNVPAAMYIFPVGGHGWGMRADFVYHNEMKSLLKSWLEKL